MELSVLFDLIQKYDGLIGIGSIVFITWLGTKFVAKEYFASFEKEQAKNHAALVAKVDATEDRLTIIEKDMEHLPDRDATHRLELAVLRLEGKMEAMDERLKPVAEMARRTQEHLMDSGR